LLPHVASQTAFSIIIVALFSVVLSARRRLVPFLLYTAVGVMVFQVLIVALLSRLNLHPDEFSHVFASTFFQDHLFKLAVDHPAMLKTLIPGWGTSYLYENDIVYSLAEKFTSVLTAFGLQDYLRYRLFNFLLLPMLLLVFMADRRNGMWFLLALGLTSQTWYLFAYFNGDALGMFFSFLLGYYFITKRTEIERFFWEKPQFGAVILGFYILCVLIFFTRLQYAIFVFFILGLIYVMKLVERDFWTLMKGSIRILIFLLLVTVPVGMAEFKDQITNDFENGTAIQKIRAENKGPEFKKQHIIATGKNPYNLFLKDTGAPYFELFTEHPWLETSFVSSFGVYGYMNILAPMLFYVISSFVGVGLTFIFLSVSAFRASSRFRIVVAYFFFSAFLVLIQSTMYSWLYAFQPQGRYLLAIIPMLAVVLALNPMQKTLPNACIQRYALMVYLVNGTGFAIYGVLPMIGFR
jgi:ABC-type multidrug transport system fused ATPase/permease subunit